MRLACPHCGAKGITVGWRDWLSGADCTVPRRCDSCGGEVKRRWFSWQMLVAALPFELAILAIFLPLHPDLKLALFGAGLLPYLVLRAVWVPFVPYSTSSAPPVVIPPEDEAW